MLGGALASVFRRTAEDEAIEEDDFHERKERLMALRLQRGLDDRASDGSDDDRRREKKKKKKHKHGRSHREEDSRSHHHERDRSERHERSERRERHEREDRHRRDDGRYGRDEPSDERRGGRRAEVDWHGRRSDHADSATERSTSAAAVQPDAAGHPAEDDDYVTGRQMSDVSDLHELWNRNRAAKKRRRANCKDVAAAAAGAV